MITSRGSFRATVEAEHRDGEGNLIAKSVSIQAPSPPQCVRIRCLWRFVCEVMLCGLLTVYHRKRFTYAERNRHKKIPENYRTGENSPTNIRQAIFAIIKLTIIGGTRQWRKLKLLQIPG